MLSLLLSKSEMWPKQIFAEELLSWTVNNLSDSVFSFDLCMF
jgi:hypothetical protein